MSRLLRAEVHYFKCRCAASAHIIEDFSWKYMVAIGQHQRLSLVNGLLQMFSQADKLRTVSRWMPGVKKKKKKKKKRIFESKN